MDCYYFSDVVWVFLSGFSFMFFFFSEDCDSLLKCICLFLLQCERCHPLFQSISQLNGRFWCGCVYSLDSHVIPISNHIWLIVTCIQWYQIVCVWCVCAYEGVWPVCACARACVCVCLMAHVSHACIHMFVCVHACVFVNVNCVCVGA